MQCGNSLKFDISVSAKISRGRCQYPNEEEKVKYFIFTVSLLKLIFLASFLLQVFMKMKLLLCLVFACSILNLIKGEVCDGAKVEAVGFTTVDATIVTKIAYIADFTITCSNGAKDISLYAETNSGIIGVARSVDGIHYQVSWVEDTAVAPSGEQPIKLFDEHGYAALRKAQRSGEDSSAVKPVATVNLYHPGAYRGPWVQSETVAILSIIGIYYYAFSQRAIIMA